MRNVARFGEDLVVYNNDTKVIVGTLSNGSWIKAQDDSNETVLTKYNVASVQEATDLTLKEVKTYIDKRFKLEHNDNANVNDTGINVSIDENGNLVVVFPDNFVTYGDGEQDLMPSAGYNVTAHLKYTDLFKDIDTTVEGNYSFKIKSYDAKGTKNKVLEKL